MNEHYELTITAKDAQNREAVKHVEYRATHAETPADAIKEYQAGLDSATRNRIREIDTES
jgi:hypothetical protein